MRAADTGTTHAGSDPSPQTLRGHDGFDAARFCSAALPDSMLRNRKSEAEVASERFLQVLLRALAAWST